MSFWGYFSADPWLAPITGLAAVGLTAAAILLRDHLRLERYTTALEADVNRLNREIWHLRETSECDRTVVAAQRDLIVLRDGDGHIIFANESFAQLAQNSPNALVGSKSLPKPVAARPPRALEGNAVVIEEAYRGPDGERWVEWIEAPVGEDGREGMLRVGRDITARVLRAQQAATGGEPVAAASAGAEPSAVAISPIQPPEPANTAGRVLLIEDDEINALLAIKSVERAGALVDWARNGQDGLTLVEASFSGARPTYDVILMDIRMPGIDGIETTQRIRALETRLKRSNPIRIVALTATTMKQDRLAAEAAGVDAFLSKPYRADTLIELLVPAPGRLARAS
jgi:CheY-like chemotaxis protein